MGAMSRARVLILNAALGPLDYRVPHGMTVKPGSIVVAPLGPRQLIGVVWEEDSFPDIETVGDNRLRNLLEVVDAPPLPETLRRLIEWTADYYLAPLAAVLRMALSSMAALEGTRTVIEYRATGAAPERMTEQRAQALERIGERQGLIRELAMIGGVSDAVIRGLIKQDIFEPVEVSVDTPFPMPDPGHAQPLLSEAQTSAATTMADAVRSHDFAPFLLDGVTGSGKTESFLIPIIDALLEESARGALGPGVRALLLYPMNALANHPGGPAGAGAAARNRPDRAVSGTIREAVRHGAGQLA